MAFVGPDHFIRIRIPDTAQLLIRIRIQGNYTDSTDPDPQHWAFGFFLNKKIAALRSQSFVGQLRILCYLQGTSKKCFHFANRDVLLPVPVPTGT